jgi:plasmid stabilization system protein ParE
MNVEWSRDALADLDRFAEFLHDKHPAPASRVAREIKAKAHVLAEHPQSGRPLTGREEYRQIVLVAQLTPLVAGAAP